MFSRRDYTRVLNLIGLVLVGLDLAQRSLRDAPAAMVAAAWLGWSLWAVTVALPDRFGRTRAGLFVVMLAAGAFVAATTDVVGFVPGIVALLALAGTPAVPLRLVGAAIAGAVLLIGAAALITPTSWGTAVTVLAVLLICTLGGFSRRQLRAAEAQSRALLEERALVAALSERSRIARDLHDVLAHSLGGLVIQLEAVDALLESGRGAEARERVIAARSLAVSGLDEAKQAVTALREPPSELATVFADLVATHHAVGGEVVVHGRADDGVLTATGRTALGRAVQELLTNARRHAPGAVTTIAWDWDDAVLTLTATTPAGGPKIVSPTEPPAPPHTPSTPNPDLDHDRASGLPRATLSPSHEPAGGLASPTEPDRERTDSVPRAASSPGDERAGGGFGLAGMRERVAEAGGTMTVRPGPPFVVTLRLPREVRA